jgi:hypothetical protein
VEGGARVGDDDEHVEMGLISYCFLEESLTQLTLNADDLQNVFADDFSLSRPRAAL